MNKCKNFSLVIFTFIWPGLLSGEVSSKQNLPLLQLQLAQTSLAEAGAFEPSKLKKTLSGLEILAHDNYLSPFFEKIALKIYQTHPELIGEVFDDKWLLYLGLALEEEQQPEAALKYYGQISPTKPSYFAGTYFAALIYHQQANMPWTIKMIQKGLAAAGGHEDNITVHHLRLLLARIYFENKNYRQAIGEYRQIPKSSPLYFTALKEQVWPLFKAHHIKHALGIIYSAQSPFFKNKFIPELDLLKSILNYSICRYDDSRQALANFNDIYTPLLAALNTFLGNQVQQSTRAYEVFEHFTHGVEAKTLGLPETILHELAQSAELQEQNSLLQSARAELEILHNMRSRLGEELFLQHKTFLEGSITASRSKLAEKVLAHLTQSKTQLDKLFAQAKLLYLEILMSQKEQLLGSELHKDVKLAALQADLQSLFTVPKNSQTWAEDKKQEYWWDEIGNHVSALPDQCIK